MSLHFIAIIGYFFISLAFMMLDCKQININPFQFWPISLVQGDELHLKGLNTIKANTLSIVVIRLAFFTPKIHYLNYQ